MRRGKGQVNCRLLSKLIVSDCTAKQPKMKPFSYIRKWARSSQSEPGHLVISSSRHLGISSSRHLGIFWRYLLRIVKRYLLMSKGTFWEILKRHPQKVCVKRYLTLSPCAFLLLLHSFAGKWPLAFCRERRGGRVRFVLKLLRLRVSPFAFAATWGVGFYPKLNRQTIWSVLF